MSKYVSIGKLAEEYSVSTQTIRNWEKSGMFKEAKRTLGNHRRFLSSEIYEEKHEERKTIIYSRVSSHEQKADMKRQTEELVEYCKQENHENIEVIEDIGSGINYKKRGLIKLIGKIVLGHVKQIVISFKDRLLRFGIEILEEICKLKDVDLIILNNQDEKSFEYQLSEDVLAILTVYSSRIYGRRSHQKRAKVKLL